MRIPSQYTANDDERPVYERIADAMRNDIRNARLSVGARLLPEDKLAASFGVSLVTMQRALKVVTAEKLLERNRKGTFVAKHAAQLADYKTIGLIMPTLGAELTLSQSPANYLIFDGIQKFCRARDWDIQIIHRKNALFSWDKISHVAGMIVVMPNKESYGLIDDLKKHDIPFVCVHLHSEGMNKDVNYINTDFYGAAMDAVQYLYDRGKRGIAIVQTHEMSDVIHQFHIVNGYKHAARQLGMNLRVIRFYGKQNIFPDDLDDFFRRELSEIKKHDAVITTDELTTISLFNALKSIGDDIMPEKTALFGFYDSEILCENGITVYALDLPSLGHEGARLLAETLKSDGGTLRQLKVKPKLLIRKTAY